MFSSVAALAGVLRTPRLQVTGSVYEVVANKIMTVAVNSAAVRAKPSIQSQVLKKLPRGTKVSVKEMTASVWAHVQVDSTDGYILSTLSAERAISCFE